MSNYMRPMYMELKPEMPIKASTGSNLRCNSWEIEAALRKQPKK